MSSTQRGIFGRLATLAGALTLVFGVSSANAVGLVGTQVTATLLSPNGIAGDSTAVSLTDTVTVVSPGAEISAGNGTNIGGFMLTNANSVSEFIDFDGFTIAIRLLSGDDGGGTGYASGAMYVFSGLAITGFDIIGASITSNSGFSNFSTSWLSFDNTTDVVSLAIDTMQFSGATNLDRVGNLMITLQTQANCVPGTPGCGGGVPVPEPTSLALLVLALAGMGVVSRRRPSARPAAS